MFEALGIVSGVLTVVSYVPYTRDIFLKRVRPERMSWLVWSLNASLAFATQAAQGATRSLWFTGIDAVGSYLTFALAIRYGTGGLTRRDIGSLAILGVGLIVWGITDNAVYSLIFAIVIDAVGAGLTIWKTLEQPDSETYPAWLILWAASLLAIFSVGKLNIGLLLFPAYMFVATGCIVGAIFLGRRTARSHLTTTTEDLPLSADGDHHGPSMLGEAYWSHNPVQVDSVTSLSIPIEYTAASVVGGEYVGVRDPGPGKGVAMVVADGHLRAEVTMDIIGAHPINIRAKDNNDTWSEFSSTVLTVMPATSSSLASAENAKAIPAPSEPAATFAATIIKEAARINN